MNINEAREQANVNFRAQRLFEDGYSVSRMDEDTLKVTNSEGTDYTVSTLFETCTCPYFVKNEGKKVCKHLLGVEQLEKTQAEYEAARVAIYDPNEEYAEGYDSTNLAGMLW